MDIFGGWKGYQNLLEQNWRERIAPEDTVVLAGDFSWGMTLRSLRQTLPCAETPRTKDPC